MPNITVWTPDTCDCEIHVETDAEGNFIGVPHHVPCDLHKDSPDPFEHALGDNQRKNLAVGHYAQAMNIEPHEVVWEVDKGVPKVGPPEGTKVGPTAHKLAHDDAVQRATARVPHGKSMGWHGEKQH